MRVPYPCVRAEIVEREIKMPKVIVALRVCTYHREIPQLQCAVREVKRVLTCATV